MINQEIRNRIKLSVAAYAYEFLNDSIMSDHDFDQLSLQINPQQETGNKKIDDFFKKHFKPDTGMWIRAHPEIGKLNYLYKNFYKTT